MKVDTTAINLPKKKLRDVLVGEIYSVGSVCGNPHMRIIPSRGDPGFVVLALHSHQFYTPSEDSMDDYVFMLDGKLIIKMIEGEENDSNKK